MSNLDLSSAKWRKSSRSGGNGNCVEVADVAADGGRVIAVRDSKDPAGPALVFTPGAWAVFVKGVTRADED